MGRGFEEETSMPDESRPRRVRFVVLVTSLVALLVAAAIVPWFWMSRPRTEIEEVLAVHADLVDATIDGDYERIVDDILASSWMEHDDRNALIAACRESDERWPEERRDEIRRFRELRILSVEVDAGRANVVCDPTLWHGAMYNGKVLPDGHDLEFHYGRADGGWRFCGVSILKMGFKTLERKVSADLPKRPWRDFTTDTIVTIGPEGLAEEGVLLLTRRIRSLFPDSPETATVVLDVAPTASWGSAVMAHDAIRQAGVENIRFAEAAAAGPESGVRVNGTPVTESPSSDASSRARLTAARVLTIGDRSGRPTEIRLVCPNAATIEGVPWIIETSFSNHGGSSVAAPRMRHTDASVVLIVEPADDAEGEETRIAATGDAPPRVVIRPNERVARLDVIPWKAGAWTVRAEVLGAHGRLVSMPEVSLTTRAHLDSGVTAEEARVQACAWIDAERWDPSWLEKLSARGAAVTRLVRASGAEAKPALAALVEIARTHKEPSLRLLAAVCALRQQRETGLRLFRDLARPADRNDGLSEAASRLLGD
jgi:hypothetical protein